LESVFALRHPAWDEIKASTFISFVKSTKTTNTSVTSGVASQALEPGERAGILNCGTGPVKFQFYQTDRRGVVRVLEDSKPKTVSMTSLVVPGLYEPAPPAVAVPAAELTRQLGEQLAERLPRHGNDILVLACITGLIRAAWQRSGPEQRKAFDQCARAVLEPLGVEPWDGESYFISQEDEGRST